jgi:PBSX family phage terminase large subunit
MSKFAPLEWQVKPFRDKSLILLMDGGSGSGKSRLAAEKIHGYCLKYAGATGIVGRKDRASAAKSVVPILRYAVQSGTDWGEYKKTDMLFEYNNGSLIYVTGLKDDNQLEALKSIAGKKGDPDIIWFEEANALSLTDHETLTTRLRGKVAPWQQLIYTCNPDSPEHWINKLLIEGGGATRYHSLPTDNPFNSEQYITILDNLTGIRKQKYRHGLWVRAEGVIYSEYDSSKHLVDLYDLKIDKDGRFIVGIDFGYTNPFSASLWHVDYDGKLYQIKQIYHTRRTVSEHVPAIREMVSGYPIEAWITDHDAEDRATLEREMGIRTTPAHKSVKDGIEAVKQRYKDDRLFHCRGLLVDEDLSLRDKKLPTCTYEEIPGYHWSDKKQDTPVKDNDHGCDEMRYVVAYVDDIGGRYMKFNPKATVSSYINGGEKKQSRPGF